MNHSRFLDDALSLVQKNQFISLECRIKILTAAISEFKKHKREIAKKERLYRKAFGLKNFKSMKQEYFSKNN